MKADNDNSGDARDGIDDVDAVDGVLARARRATDGIEPPADFAARVLAATAATSRARPVRSTSWWSQLGPAGWRVVPFAAVAAAAAVALAWSADAHLDETADAAIDIAQGLP